MRKAYPPRVEAVKGNRFTLVAADACAGPASSPGGGIAFQRAKTFPSGHRPEARSVQREPRESTPWRRVRPTRSLATGAREGEGSGPMDMAAD